MRKQYYFRRSERGLMAWDVDRLVALTKQFSRMNVPLAGIRELDAAFSSEEDDILTWRAVAEHANLIAAADLCFPIILSSDGSVMDGMHRVAKAVCWEGLLSKPCSSRKIPPPTTWECARANFPTVKLSDARQLQVRRLTR